MEKTVLMSVQQLSPKLFVASDEEVRTYNLNEKLLMGRASGTYHPDIEFVQKFVSRKHGVFEVDSYGCYYMDTNQVNGTFYNGKKLVSEQKQYLKNGDVLNIYRSNVATPEDMISMIYMTDYPGNYSWDNIDVSSELSEILIGRKSGGVMGFTDKTISVNHAIFSLEDDGWYIIDCASMNGVFVNGKRVYQQKNLKIGDCIRISNINFVFMRNRFVYQHNLVPVQHITSAGSGLSIQIINRSVWQRAKKLMLLQDINMTIQNGELVLILGGSGAGKTTFMNAVMGYEKAKGKIVHNDTDMYKKFKTIKHKIGFVPQLDLVRGNDTVYDTLSNAAELKLSAEVISNERILRVEKVLETLGLQRERNSLVSKLSGGQRKRLSIAIEYIADPSLFFLDEPDSGLDGIMAKTLMQNLRAIADEQKIVMVISHAPDRVAELFDKIIVLAKSVKDNCGHLAFFGSVEEAKAFFGTTSLEGVVQRINRPDEGGDGLSDYYIEKYKQKIEGGNL